MSRNTSMPVKKVTLLALFTTLSLAIYAIESAVPPLVPIPGIKLGLANIVTLVLLRHFSARDAALVLLARILLSALLFGQALSLLYSLAARSHRRHGRSGPQYGTADCRFRCDLHRRRARLRSFSDPQRYPHRPFYRFLRRISGKISAATSHDLTYLPSFPASIGIPL